MTPEEQRVVKWLRWWASLRNPCVATLLLSAATHIERGYHNREQHLPGLDGKLSTYTPEKA